MQPTNRPKKSASHAWVGSWTRPMKIDENSHDPLTVARMTDHNVRGGIGGEVSELGGLEKPIVPATVFVRRLNTESLYSGLAVGFALGFALGFGLRRN